MSLLDGLLLVPILYFAFKGYRNGIIKEVLSLVGIVLAIFICIHFTGDFSSFLNHFFNHIKKYLPYISGIILFLLTLTAIEIIIYVSTKIVVAVELGIINRLLGLLFGAFKSALIISIFLVLLAGFDIPNAKTRSKSFTYPYVIELAPATYNVVAAIYPGAHNYSDTIKNTLDKYNPLNNLQKAEKK